jgi:hypothetical protein
VARSQASTVVLAPRRRGGLVVAAVLGLGAMVLAGVLIGSVALPNLFATTVREQPDSVVLAKIEAMAELEAASGRFETIVDVEKDANLLPDWVKGEHTVLVAEGDVVATVDLADLDDDALEVSEDGRHVTVHLPPPTLQAAQLDREVTRVISRDRGFFDRVDDALTSGDPTDDEELYVRAEEKLNEAAAQSDLSDRAEASATDTLTGLLENAGFERVTVVFDAVPPEPGDSL